MKPPAPCHPPATPDMTRFHVLTSEFLHETNTFCKLPTGLEAFAERGLLYGDEAIAARKDNNTELAGFLDADLRIAQVLARVGIEDAAGDDARGRALDGPGGGSLTVRPRGERQSCAQERNGEDSFHRGVGSIPANGTLAGKNTEPARAPARHDGPPGTT